MKFEVLTMASMKNTVFWVMTPSRLVDVYPVSKESTTAFFTELYSDLQTTQLLVNRNVSCNLNHSGHINTMQVR